MSFIGAICRFLRRRLFCAAFTFVQAQELQPVLVQVIDWLVLGFQSANHRIAMMQPRFKLFESGSLHVGVGIFSYDAHFVTLSMTPVVMFGVYSPTDR